MYKFKCHVIFNSKFQVTFPSRDFFADLSRITRVISVLDKGSAPSIGPTETAANIAALKNVFNSACHAKVKNEKIISKHSSILAKIRTAKLL